MEWVNHLLFRFMQKPVGFFNSILIMYTIKKISHALYSWVTVEAAESECNLTIPMVQVQEESNLVMKNGIFQNLHMVYW